MTRFVTEQTIARPAQDVWAYAVDIGLRGRWQLLAPILAMEGKAAPARELQRLKDHAEQGLDMAPAMS